MTVEVKICGVTSIEDALGSVDAGADAIGLNFWAGSPRCVNLRRAREIADAVGDRALLVGVFVDADVVEVKRVRAETGVVWAQLHGSEPPAVVEALLPEAYKAIGVPAEEEDTGLSGVRNISTVGAELAEAIVRDRVELYPGEHILLDARVPGAMPGGTGRTFDWDIAAEIAELRKLTLAGGLTPDNVADAVVRVRPFRVDVASGVESEPGRKDLERVRRFVTSAKGV